MTKTKFLGLAMALCFGAAFSTASIACHKTAPKAGAKVKKQVCQGCHSYEQLAKQTAKVEPNPHYSHLGDVNCTDCHKGHKKSELMCNSCHQFDLKVPH